jgi:hypothetical protein
VVRLIVEADARTVWAPESEPARISPVASHVLIAQNNKAETTLRVLAEVRLDGVFMA